MFFSCDNGSVDKALDASASNIKTSEIIFGLSAPGSDGGPMRKINASLSADPGAEVISYKYKAEPLFELDSGLTPFGTVREWQPFTIGDAVGLSQGLWHFTVAAFDSSDHIIMYGECETYINMGINFVDVDLELSMGTGSIRMDVTIPQVSSQGGHLTVNYTLVGEKTKFFTDFAMTRSDGILRFTGTLDDLEVGFYTLAFTFGDEYVGYHYGEVITVEVLEDHQAVVSGEFTSGNLLLKGKTTVMENDLDEIISLLCGSQGAKFDWYVDDVLVQSGSNRNFLYKADEYGNFEIKCIVDEDTVSPAVCHLKIADSIEINLYYFNNPTPQRFRTYSGVSDQTDLPPLGELSDGYWYTAPEDGNGGGGTRFTSMEPFTEGMDLYAHREWITVTFDGNRPSYNGTTYTANVTPATVSGYKGDHIGLLPEATINAAGLRWVTFVLNGWGTEVNGGTRVHEHTALTENTTYYAQWIAVPTSIFGGSVDDGDDTKCTVSFVIRDSGWSLSTTTVDTQIVPTGGYLEIPKVSLESGKAFRGWYGSALEALFDWNDKWDFTKPVTKDMTLYGEWSSSSSVYKVTYDTDGGTLDPSSINVLEGESAPVPTDPVKSGYIFAGWYKNSAKTEKFDFNTEVINSNTTIYALWYERLEYIENVDGNDAYFIIPYTPNEKTGVDIKFWYGGHHSRTIFGSSDFRLRGNSILRIFEADYGSTTYQGREVRFDQGPCKMHLCRYHGFGVINAETPSNAFNIDVSPVGSFNDDVLLVFRDNSTPESAHGKLYYLQLHHDHTLIGDLYPCRRLSDRKVGMYDTLNDIFYSSANEYEFVAGPRAD